MMLKLISNLGKALNKTEQQSIRGGGSGDSNCNYSCCSCDDDCMDPTTEDNGYSYFICSGGACEEIPY
jgi:hypothetical protein